MVSLAGCHAHRKSLIEAAKLFIGQINIQGPEILFEIARVFRSWDGDDILALSEHPGKGQLRGPTGDFL